MKVSSVRARHPWAWIGLAALVLAVVTGAPAHAGERGYIGIYMQTLTQDIRDGLDLDLDHGVLVSGVEDDSPAQKAGLEDGDVIVEFDGKAVDSPNDLRDLVGEREPGARVSLVVIRDGERKTLEIELGERPEGWSVFDFGGKGDRWHFRDGPENSFAMFFGGPRLGVEATELNDDLAGYFDTKPGDGILVIGVRDGSVAEKAGVKSGDVIQKVGDEKVATVDDLRESLSDYEEGDQFAISVLRKGHEETLDATMDDQSVHSFWSGDHPRARVHVDRLRDIDREDIDKALDEMRGEIKTLKKEIEKLRKER